MDEQQNKITDGEKEMFRSQSSVEVSTTAKGEKSWKVKVYADTIDEAIDKAVEADNNVRQKLGK